MAVFGEQLLAKYLGHAIWIEMNLRFAFAQSAEVGLIPQ